MNKQEAIEKIERRSDYFSSEKDYDRGYRAGLDSTLLILRELDEPEKPVVPQFVADWYEGHKNDFEYNLYRLCINFHERKLHEDLHEWFNDDKNKPIEVLVLTHKFGYEVEKEKLYTVEFPNPNSDNHLLLRKNFDGKVCVSLLHSEYWRGNESTRLTEAEIKEDFDWAWQFAEEVEND